MKLCGFTGGHSSITICENEFDLEMVPLELRHDSLSLRKYKQVKQNNASSAKRYISFQFEAKEKQLESTLFAGTSK